MVFDRKKVLKATVTLKKVALDTLKDRYHFTIIENDKLCQVDKEGSDQPTDSFSKPFSCLLDTFSTSLQQFDKIDDECCGNPGGFKGVERAIYIVLKQMRGLQLEVTRHFAKVGEVVNGFKVDSDVWVTDDIKVIDLDELKKRLRDEDVKERFNEALHAIEREDDF